MDVILFLDVNFSRNRQDLNFWQIHITSILYTHMWPVYNYGKLCNFLQRTVQSAEIRHVLFESCPNRCTRVVPLYRFQPIHVPITVKL